MNKKKTNEFLISAYSYYNPTINKENSNGKVTRARWFNVISFQIIAVVYHAPH